MKIIVLVLFGFWWPVSQADEGIILNVHLQEFSRSEAGMIPVSYYPDDPPHNGLFHKYFKVKSRNMIFGNFLALRTRDTSASAAILEFLAERESVRELTMRSVKDSMAFIYPGGGEPMMMAFDWDALSVQTQGEWVELKELMAYLHYVQGFFDRNYKPEFVHRAMTRYFVARMRPHFGSLARCDRILAHIPFYDPRR